MPSFPSKPVTTKALHKMLTNPYYQGSVTFRGVTYDGTHDPLVDTETWLRVQTELAAKNQRGEKPRTHDHYLKGTLYCSCGAKMMIECPTGKSGITYEYLTCAGRRKKNGCTRSAILTDRIEDRIDSTYGANGLTPDEADRVREVLGAVFDQLEATTDDERALLTTQKEKLDAERLKLVQAHYADAIPLDLRKSEQERIRTTLDAIEHRQERLATNYEDAREASTSSPTSSPISATSTRDANLLNAASSTEPSSTRSSSTTRRPSATSPTGPFERPWAASPLVTRGSSLSKRLTPKTLRTLPACLRGRVRKCHFWWS